MIPVYVVHLPNEDRKAHISAELARVGFTDITYIHATEPVSDFSANNMRRNPRGEFGCALSHLKAIATAINDNAEEALFVEDDVVFTDNAWLRLGNALDQLELVYRVLYLGGHPRGPVEPCGWIDLVELQGGFSCAEAYCMTGHSMREFLQFWCDRAGQKNAMIDFILGEYAGQGKGYAFYPQLTHQPPGYSYIGQKQDDKRDLIKRGWASNLSIK